MSATQPPPPIQINTQFPFRQKVDIFSFHNRDIPATNVIADHKNKIAYVPIPKNACTSLKIFFYELIGGKDYPEHFSKIHGRFDYLAVDFESFCADQDYFKFMVVRDPIERFVSAYNNRIKHYRELTKGWFATHDKNAPKVFEFFAANSLAYDPDINEFARRITDYIKVSGTIRHHFFPQHNFFYGRPEVFTKIYNIRQLPELASDLQNRIGAPVRFPSVQETANLKNAARLSDLGPAELDGLKTFYADDYRILKPYL